MKLPNILLTTAIIFSSLGLQAEPINKSAISKKFQSLIPMGVEKIEKSPVEGLIQIVTDKGIFYATEDGEHLISGSMYEFKPGLNNLTKQRIGEDAARIMNDLKSSFITYKAAEEKHEIVVFYDTSCGYCRKLHNEVTRYNAAGITVHYAGYPRAGVKDRSEPSSFSGPFKDLMSIWCADSPKSALNRNANNQSVQPRACETALESHRKLGERLGVSGTPAVFNLDGGLVTRGYAPAPSMLEAIRKVES